MCLIGCPTAPTVYFLLLIFFLKRPRLGHLPPVTHIARRMSIKMFGKLSCRFRPPFEEHSARRPRP